MLTVSEADAFATCRRLARTEGFLVGVSAGAAACAALRVAQREQSRGQLIVCVLADRGERYLSVDGLYDV